MSERPISVSDILSRHEIVSILLALCEENPPVSKFVVSLLIAWYLMVPGHLQTCWWPNLGPVFHMGPTLQGIRNRILYFITEVYSHVFLKTWAMLKWYYDFCLQQCHSPKFRWQKPFMDLTFPSWCGVFQRTLLVWYGFLIFLSEAYNPERPLK